MNKEQERQVKKKVVNILTSDTYKNSACTKNSAVVIQTVLNDMKADDIHYISDAVVMRYFQSVFFDLEISLSKADNIRKHINGVKTQAPKSMPVTAKLSAEAVKKLGYKIGRKWFLERV